MIVKTKKYELPTNTYIGVAFKSVLKEQWWVGLIYLAICGCYFLIPSWWWVIGATIALALYLLFWLIQFAGVTQMEQGKFMFQKMSYEISSQQILLKINTKQGMPMKWDQIKRAVHTKDAFILFASKAQLLYFPHKIFNNDNEIRFIDTVLKRKGFIK
ncbi:YcxB family protein [Marinoscillum sp. MHG1-6]|uniref:YcxB family protein n=1 Tax=Marinoscillum sp. MHG1-6 TaxID=2959627 RepID=UPI0021580070|nr:YcxB family protein [Marinoscillum sp. MHG1-6]